jgi:hypothetical protein
MLGFTAQISATSSHRVLAPIPSTILVDHTAQATELCKHAITTFSVGAWPRFASLCSSGVMKRPDLTDNRSLALLSFPQREFNKNVTVL